MGKFKVSRFVGWMVLGAVPTFWTNAYAQQQDVESPKSWHINSFYDALNSAWRDHDLWNPLYTGNFVLPVSIPAQIRPMGALNVASAWAKGERWWELILRPEVCDRAIANVAALQGLGRGDDCFASQFELDGAKVQVIDGRTFSVLVKIPDAWKQQSVSFEPTDTMSLGASWTEHASYPKYDVTLETPAERVAHLAYRKIFGFDNGNEKFPMITRIVRKFADERATYGTVISGRNSAGWIMDGGITWWSDGVLVCFDVQKFEKPVESKTPLRGKNYFSGLPAAASGAFQRFSDDYAPDYNSLLGQSFKDPRIVAYRRFGRKSIGGLNLPKNSVISESRGYRFSLTSNQNCYWDGDDISLSIQLQNKSNRTIYLLDGKSLLNYWLTVVTPSGERVSTTPLGYKTLGDTFQNVVLAPGKSMTLEFKLAKAMVLKEFGVYKIMVTKEVPDRLSKDRKFIQLSTGFLEVEIRHY